MRDIYMPSRLRTTPPFPGPHQEIPDLVALFGESYLERMAAAAIHDFDAIVFDLDGARRGLSALDASFAQAFSRTLGGGVASGSPA